MPKLQKLPDEVLENGSCSKNTSPDQKGSWRCWTCCHESCMDIGNAEGISENEATVTLERFNVEIAEALKVSFWIDQCSTAPLQGSHVLQLVICFQPRRNTWLLSQRDILSHVLLWQGKRVTIFEVELFSKLLRWCPDETRFTGVLRPLRKMNCSVLVSMAAPTNSMYEMGSRKGVLNAPSSEISVTLSNPLVLATPTGMSNNSDNLCASTNASACPCRPWGLRWLQSKTRNQLHHGG